MFAQHGQPLLCYIWELRQNRLATSTYQDLAINLAKLTNTGKPQKQETI